MCVCVSDSSLGCTHLRFHCYFAVILCHFHQDKKKATSLPVSYCLLSLIVDRSILKLRHNIYRNRFPHTVYLVLSTPLPSADYLWIW